MARTGLWMLLLLLVLPGLALGQGEGAKVFEHCTACHQGNGQGIVGAFPPLVGHAPDVARASRTYLIQVVMYGLEGKIRIPGQQAEYNGIMPSHSFLKDQEIAAVLNYVLTNWGNDKLLPKGFKPIRSSEVKAQRGKHLTAKQVYQLRQKLKLTK